jgi:hypothetical protein
MPKYSSNAFCEWPESGRTSRNQNYNVKSMGNSHIHLPLGHLILTIREQTRAHPFGIADRLRLGLSCDHAAENFT